mmetsp:Transcript_37407/g.117809  ORF Transcript_37407/g.117809 Transcript_37407/m.117809 type:complete len:309 (-) Transcript_37407:1281-2207(-)
MVMWGACSCRHIPSWRRRRPGRLGGRLGSQCTSRSRPAPRTTLQHWEGRRPSFPRPRPPAWSPGCFARSTPLSGRSQGSPRWRGCGCLLPRQRTSMPTSSRRKWRGKVYLCLSEIQRWAAFLPWRRGSIMAARPSAPRVPSSCHLVRGSGITAAKCRLLRTRLPRPLPLLRPPKLRPAASTMCPAGREILHHQAVLRPAGGARLLHRVRAWDGRAGPHRHLALLRPPPLAAVEIPGSNGGMRARRLKLPISKGMHHRAVFQPRVLQPRVRANLRGPSWRGRGGRATPQPPCALLRPTRSAGWTRLDSV